MNQSVLSDCEVKLPAGEWDTVTTCIRVKLSGLSSLVSRSLAWIIAHTFCTITLPDYFHLVCIYACDTRIFQQLGACLEFQTHLGGFFISSLWGDLSHGSAMGAPQGLDWAVMIPEKRVSWQCGEGSRKFCHGHATLCTEQALKKIAVEDDTVLLCKRRLLVRSWLPRPK